MALLRDLLADLDDLLEPGRYRDFCPNGLQVPPPAGLDAEIRTVVTAVSADRQALGEAVALGGDLVIVHHGLFWDGDPRALEPPLAERLRLVLGAGLALAAYHLPLDGHPTVGNNALLAEALGASAAPWAGSGDPAIGVEARFEEPLPLAALASRVAVVTGREPLVLPGEAERPVGRLGIVSGAAAGLLPRAAEDGLDALLTGEPREPTRGLALELGVHAICAGHHATETRGVQALGAHLARHHGVSHRFVDTGNPV